MNVTEYLEMEQEGSQYPPKILTAPSFFQFFNPPPYMENIKEADKDPHCIEDEEVTSNF